ncbi:MAG: GAF domain-containing protein, partial [Chloroflexota bacterium]|nr:GAF domain-containing protein [Chloroflexota bacterium]
MAPDPLQNVSSELRVIGEALVRIARSLHEQTRQLEIAVEGRYAGELDNPRVVLLNDSLNVSRAADIELGKLNQSLRNAAQRVQMAAPINGSATLKFEREREALATSISHLKREKDELSILYEIAGTLNSTLQFDEVLRLVMDRVIEFVNAERGFLMLINPDTKEPEFRMARNKEARTISESEFSTAQISRSTVMRVINTRTPVLTDNAQTDAALQGMESIMTFGILSIMCAPLIVRNTCIGAVYVDSRINEKLFAPRHLDMMLAFCNQAAIAIDNARLFAQVQEDKRYMENIFKSIANGIITTDSSGIITTFNAAASVILNLRAATAIGKHYQQAFASIPQVGLVNLLRNAPQQHMQPENSTLATNSVDCQIPGRPGDVSLNCYVSSLRDSQGKDIGMALVIDDRTELKRSLAQARRIRSIFERYVHPNVVQELIRDPQALNLGGETKEISVVFADIRGYTSLSERMAPADVMNLINRYLQLMCEAIWEEEGTITAFQGDALMAIFNAPLQQQNHALRAIRSAWKMRSALEAYQRSQPQEAIVRYGIGVNTGQATVGNIGSQDRLQNYTAIGDVVNVASRLQNGATDNNIYLNESTYIQVYRYVKVSHPFPL